MVFSQTKMDKRFAGGIIAAGIVAFIMLLFVIVINGYFGTKKAVGYLILYQLYAQIAVR